MADELTREDYEEEVDSIKDSVIMVPVDKLTVHPLSLQIYGQKIHKERSN